MCNINLYLFKLYVFAIAKANLLSKIFKKVKILVFGYSGQNLPVLRGKKLTKVSVFKVIALYITTTDFHDVKLMNYLSVIDEFGSFFTSFNQIK